MGQPQAPACILRHPTVVQGKQPSQEDQEVVVAAGEVFDLAVQGEVDAVCLHKVGRGWEDGLGVRPALCCS